MDTELRKKKRGRQAEQWCVLVIPCPRQVLPGMVRNGHLCGGFAWRGFGVWEIKVDSFIFGLGSHVVGDAIYLDEMNQFGKENGDFTKHQIKIVVNESEMAPAEALFCPRENTNKNCLHFNENTFSQFLGTGFLLLN